MFVRVQNTPQQQLGLSIYQFYCHKRFLFPCISDILINELGVSSYYPYKLHLLHKLRVMSNFYCTSYELLFTHKLQVTIFCTSYKLIFIQVLRFAFCCTNYELLLTQELPLTVYCTSYELRVTFCVRVASYFLLHKL